MPDQERRLNDGTVYRPTRQAVDVPVDGEETFECELCGRQAPRHRRRRVEQNRRARVGHQFVCPTCFRQQCVSCCDCREYFYTTETHRVNGRNYCRTCYNDGHVTCVSCGGQVDRNRARQVPWSATYWCTGCFEDNHTECGGCGEYVHNDHIQWSEYHDAERCSDCCECGDSESRFRNIREYGHTEVYTYLGGTPLDFSLTPAARPVAPDLFFGVELEVDAGTDKNADECAGEILKLSQHVECKEDSSLDSGFEIVSQPATLAYHVDTLPWKGILKACRDYDFQSHNVDTCGLHVHIDRRWLTPVDQMKLAAFVNMLPKQHEAIARRARNGYAKFKNIKGQIKDSVEHPEDRYEALNYTNRRTVEFRLFKGTLKLRTFYATLHYCHAVAHFVKARPVPLFLQPEKAWASFTEYVRNNKLYAGLNAYLAERGVS